MSDRYQSNLEGLTLQNLNLKLQRLRGQLRQATDHDIKQLRYKMGVTSGRDQSPHQFHHQNANNREGTGLVNEFGNPAGSTKDDREAIIESEDLRRVQQPVYYRNLRIVSQGIDYEEVKRLCLKKISAEQVRQYMKCKLSAQVVQKMKQVWQALEDTGGQVNLKQFASKFNKSGIHFSEAVAFQIPIIKKSISLKKVLFQITYKYDYLPQKLAWQDFIQLFQTYQHPSEPTIDILIKKFKAEKIKISYNYFLVPQEVINQLKSIFKRTYTDNFIGFCSVQALASKLQSSMVLQRYMSEEVRPKSHFQVACSLAQTVQYFKRKATNFMDLDQFLLFFSVHPYAYYPIEEQLSLEDDDIEINSYNKARISKVKSVKQIKGTKSNKAIASNQYMLSYNYVRKQSKKWQDKVGVEIQEQKPQDYRFKARPFSKAKSQQKYKQFLSALEAKKKEKRQRQLLKQRKSQQELQRLKNQTRLFQIPQHSLPICKNTNFTSRPAPEACLSPRLNEIEAQKIQRRNKMLSLTQEKYWHSWKQLPYVAILKKQSPERQGSPAKIQYYRQSHQIPDYKLQHNRMEYQLQLRKMNFKPTSIQEFYLHTEKRHPCKYEAKPEIQPPQDNDYDYKAILYSPEPDIYYTQKFTQMMMVNKDHALKREMSLNQKLLEEKERQNKHKNFAKFMKGPLAKIPNTAKICELEAKAKISRHKKYWKNLDTEYEENLNEIYSKVIKRPFLYEMQSQYSKPKQKPNNQNNAIESQKRAKKKKEKKFGRTASIDVNKSF